MDSCHCGFLCYGLSLDDAGPQLYSIPSYDRSEYLSIGFRRDPPPHRPTQRGIRSEPLVLRICFLVHAHAYRRCTVRTSLTSRILHSESFLMNFELIVCFRSKNIQSVLIFRFIAGVVGSTGSTMVGGTVADIWEPHECVYACFPPEIIQLKKLLDHSDEGCQWLSSESSLSEEQAWAPLSPVGPK